MSERSPVWISAPIGALVEGIFREDTTIATVRARGDLGLGTFNDLDGEMVLVDGTVYRLRPDGDATTVGDEVQTPFAVATRFSGDTEERIDRPVALDETEALLKSLLPSPNLMYALRIDGRFGHVRARSVPRQDNYRPLSEVAAIQTVFEFDDVAGTMVGFWTPSFLQSVHVGGFHIHFVTEDRKRGGHVLALATNDVTVRLQHATRVELGLPMTLDFLAADLTRDIQNDVRAIER